MKKYKLISFDLDGTLLKSLHEISEENYEALGKLYELGVVLVPTSGRSLYEIPEKVRKCPYFKYAITSGGAATYSLPDEQLIDSALLTKEESDELFDLLSRYKTVTMTHYQGYSYVDKAQTPEEYDKSRVTVGFKKFIPIYDTPVDNFDSFCRKMDGVELTCSFFPTDEDIKSFKEEALATGKYTVVSSARDNLEVVSKSVDKGRSVLKLAEKLSIKPEETVGVGDSINDLALIKAVGLGIAMKNAVDELKSEADTVGCHYTEHIAKFILEKYF